MRQTLWILCGLAVVTLPVHAAENVGCNTNRDLVLKQAKTNDCPEEEAEAKAITCTSSGMADVKETKRLAALVKLCMAKPKKGAGGGSAAKAETKPAAATEEVGDTSGKYQCRGVDKDGKVIVENASDKTSVDCLSELKKQIAEKTCDGSAPEVEFTYQTFTLKHWSKGISVKARCKK
jgi:hypothetical protein